MKLTNISLAILVAVGVAACGGSGDNNNPVDPPKPNPNNNNNNNNNNKPTPPAEDPHVVDPTGTQVVDDKDLTKQNTVGTLQYIRRDGSQYDRTLNPSQPASASPLLGTTLNDQNPSLTNIVLARQEIVRADGTPVKAQFAGSDNPVPLKANGDAIKDSVAGLNSLQEENFQNVDVLAGRYMFNIDTKADHHSDDGSSRSSTRARNSGFNDLVKGANNVDEKNKIKRELIDNETVAEDPTDPNSDALLSHVKQYPYVIESGTGYKRVNVNNSDNLGLGANRTGDINSNSESSRVEPKDLNANMKIGQTGLAKNAAEGIAYQSDTTAKTYTVVNDARTMTAVIDPYAIVREPTDGKLKKVYSKDVEGNKDVFMYRGTTPASETGSKKDRVAVTPRFAEKNGTRYGKDLVWWTSHIDGFENDYTRTGNYDAFYTEQKVKNGLAATNGLIRVGGGLSTLGQELNWNKDEKKWENHHNTTTRIFGRYHLAYAGTAEKNKGIHPVTFNSFSGAKAFVAEYETDLADTDYTKYGTADDKAGKATQYSIGAVPMTLKYVQYGRVSTQLDVDEGVKGYADNFIRNPYRNKNTDDSVDDYFYRGTNATTIEQMAALPSDQKATYQGHALMYGIDNDFHNAGKRNLPNAFAGKTDGLGLGNFVEATADFGTKRLQGNVYNEWLLDQTKSATTRDNLVAFQGNIVGNTVVGTADRTYLAGDDKATFKASFFGEKAEELGGSFNSVKDADKYGSAYGENDWGGVFGATRGGTSNTFQGDDSNNVYGNNQQNGQQP